MRRFQPFLLALLSFLTVTCGPIIYRTVAVALCALLGIESPASTFLSNTATAAEPPTSNQIAQIDIFSPNPTPVPATSPPPTDIFSPNPTPTPSNSSPSTDIFSNPRQPNSTSPKKTQTSTDPNSPVETNSGSASLITAQGCQIIIHSGNSGSSLATRSVEYIAKDEVSCGQSFVTQISQNGKKVEVIQKSGDRLLIETIRFDVIRMTYTDAYGKTTTEDIQIPKELLQASKQVMHFAQFDTITHSEKVKQLPGDLSQDTCAKLKKICDALSMISTSMAIIQTAALLPTALTGIGLPFAGAFLTAGVGLSFAQLPCFAAFGGDPPLPWGKALGVAGRLSRLNAVRRTAGGGLKYSRTLGQFGRFLDDKFPGSWFADGVGNVEDANNVYRGIFPDEQGGENVTWTDRLRKKLGIRTLCEKDSPIANQAAPSQPRLEEPLRQGSGGKICAVPAEFWRNHKRQIGPVNMQETACIVPGRVMTDEGEVDGQEWVGVCHRTGNNTFGQLPYRRPRSQPEDPARRNPVPNCPANWGK